MNAKWVTCIIASERPRDRKLGKVNLLLLGTGSYISDWSRNETENLKKQMKGI
jgi:hypothetical protein